MFKQYAHNPQSTIQGKNGTNNMLTNISIQVLPGLFIGDAASARNVRFLQVVKIGSSLSTSPHLYFAENWNHSGVEHSRGPLE